MSEQESSIAYKVVVNHEEQYSIWPADRDNALGWRDAGFSGPKADSLAYIKEHWTDMRPLSLRQQMANGQQSTSDAAMAANSGNISIMTNPAFDGGSVITAAAPPAAADAMPLTPTPVATEEKPKRGFLGGLFGRGKKNQ